jgi:hypothetical protein
MSIPTLRAAAGLQARSAVGLLILLTDPRSVCADAAPQAPGVALASAAVSAPAAGPPGYDDAVTRGFDAFDARRYEDALLGFLDAHALYPNARTLRALGKTELELSHYVSSLHYLESALRSDERPLSRELRADTEALCAHVRGYVARLHITLRPPDAELRIDGVVVAAREGDLTVGEGSHLLVASAPGHHMLARRVDLAGGSTTRVQLDLDVMSLRSHEAPPSSPDKRRRTWTYLAAGGFALVACALLTGVLMGRGGSAHTVPSGSTGAVIRVPALGS